MEFLVPQNSALSHSASCFRSYLRVRRCSRSMAFWPDFFQRCCCCCFFFVFVLVVLVVLVVVVVVVPVPGGVQKRT